MTVLSQTHDTLVIDALHTPVWYFGHRQNRWPDLPRRGPAAAACKPP
jgi:hypothetical protein